VYDFFLWDKEQYEFIGITNHKYAMLFICVFFSVSVGGSVGGIVLVVLWECLAGYGLLCS
jgi:hypothetical protein